MARSVVWSHLKTLQHSSSIVLASHSVDECEQLCNRVAIMVAGRFVVLGTPKQLKPEGVYIVSVQVKDAREHEGHREVGEEEGEEEEVEAGSMGGAFDVRTFLEENSPSHVLSLVQHINRVTAAVGGVSSLSLLADLFAQLDTALADGRIVDYSVSRSTLEDVFRQVVEQQHAQM